MRVLKLYVGCAEKVQRKYSSFPRKKCTGRSSGTMRLRWLDHVPASVCAGANETICQDFNDNKRQWEIKRGID